MHYTCISRVALPAHASDWYPVGPFGDSIEDIVAFDKIACEVEESCPKGAVYITQDTVQGSITGWFYVDPAVEFAMFCVTKLTKALMVNELFDDADVNDMIERLVLKAWTDMALPERIEALQAHELDTGIALDDFPPDDICDALADVIMEKHPSMGC